MTDFGRRAGEMLKSVYDSDDDGVIALAQTEADMKRSVYDSNLDGTVADSDKLEASSKAQVQDHTAKSHAHAQADVTGLVAALAGKSATGHGHTESEISDLDHNAQKIKGVIINDAAIGDQKVLAYDLGTERIVYITPAPSGASLDNLQFGEVTIAQGQASGTQSITGVDVDKSAIFLLGYRPVDGSFDTNTVRVELTDTTTVTAYQAGTTYANTVRFVVMEFSAGIESSQGDDITLSFEQTNDCTISEVDTAKALLIHLGTSGYAADIERAAASIAFLNSTTVRATAYAANAYLVVGFHVLEFS